MRTGNASGHEQEELSRQKERMTIMTQLVKSVTENAIFVLQFLAIVAAIFLVAYGVEKYSQRKQGVKMKILTTRKIAMMGMFSAISGVLMLVEVPLVFLAPEFYGLDLSELPVLICGFAFGPVAGVITEFVKIMIKLLFKPTSTAFVGELANFVVGCSLILPATIIYRLKKSKKMAVVGCMTGTACITVVGTVFNAVYLLPKFAALFGMPLDSIIAMGHEINGNINSITSFVIFAVAPMNLIKGTLVSVITMLIYKKVSPVLKHGE